MTLSNKFVNPIKISTLKNDRHTLHLQKSFALAKMKQIKNLHYYILLYRFNKIK